MGGRATNAWNHAHKKLVWRAIAFPDTVHAGLRVARLGNGSVRYEIGLFRNDEETAAAQGHFVHVYMDREPHRPAGLPIEMREARERILAH